MVLVAAPAFAQHEQHTPQPAQSGQHKPKQKKTASDTGGHSTHRQHNSHTEADTSAAWDVGRHMHEAGAPMSHAYSLHLPMNRNGSGTGWLPDASPMYGYMLHTPKWMFMFHGNAFLRYNDQDVTNKGSRGDAKVDVPNWLMAMGQRRVGKNGLFHFNVMLSADALIAGGSGYPLLFQTGESWQGRPLVDRQHPHDLFSELSVAYSYSFSPKMDAYLYLGYPGEPALGSVAFMHRPSALYNPDAPLSHHWNDATHITFGVATLGFRYGKFKIEGSSFTGREPDEDRYDFDRPRFDSRSLRLSFNPGREWSFQVSHGYIKEPELLHPGEDVYRTTASAVYAHALGGNNRFVNAAAIWGVNKTKGHTGEHIALLEGSLTLNRLAIYSRYEWVQKSGEELGLDEAVYGHDAVFPVHAITMGAAYDVLKKYNTRASLGVQASLYNADDRLNTLYGDKPLAVQVYLRLYPGLMMSGN